jgi:hypothetical protein
MLITSLTGERDRVILRIPRPASGFSFHREGGPMTADQAFVTVFLLTGDSERAETAVLRAIR